MKHEDLQLKTKERFTIEIGGVNTLERWEQDSLKNIVSRYAKRIEPIIKDDFKIRLYMKNNNQEKSKKYSIDVCLESPSLKAYSNRKNGWNLPEVADEALIGIKNKVLREYRRTKDFQREMMRQRRLEMNNWRQVWEPGYHKSS